MGERDSERDEIRASGLRATASRVAVLRFIREVASPLTHAEVVDGLASDAWDKATIYRNLIDLTEVGLLRRISLSDGFRFEDVHDHETETPVHFVCSQCDAVQCLKPWSFLPPSHGHFPRSVAEGRVEIQIRGVCDLCESTKKNRND